MSGMAEPEEQEPDQKKVWSSLPLHYITKMWKVGIRGENSLKVKLRVSFNLTLKHVHKCAATCRNLS